LKIPRGGMMATCLVNREAGIGAECLAERRTWPKLGSVIEVRDRPRPCLREDLLDKVGAASHVPVERRAREPDRTGDKFERETFAADAGQMMFCNLQDSGAVLTTHPGSIRFVFREVHKAVPLLQRAYTLIVRHWAVQLLWPLRPFRYGERGHGL
jgi:hypothetical protein